MSLMIFQFWNIKKWLRVVQEKALKMIPKHGKTEAHCWS